MFGFNLRRLPPVAALFAFAFVVFAVDRVASTILGHTVLLSHNRIAQVYSGKANGDVLVMGNSVADAMVTVPLLERASKLSVYTMAVHGLDARTQLAITRAYLKRNKAPQVAIMEIRPTSDRDIIARELTMFAAESPDLVSLAETQSPSLLPWRRIFHLYNFNSRALPSMLSRVVVGDDQDVSGSDGKISEAKKRRFVEKKLAVQVSAAALTAFNETIKLLQSHGTRVIVVAAPMHPITRKLGNWADRNAERVRLSLPKGTIFLNSLREFNSDDAFEDPVHMNRYGRERFALLLAHTIRQVNAAAAQQPS